MYLAPGVMIRDNLRLERPLGEGAMGSVWVAEHLLLHTRVAVKFVHADLAREDPRALERFRREATAVAQIKSAHVVQIFDKGVTADGWPFIVMELLTGQSLAERIGREGRLGLRAVCEIVTQVARALEKAHKEEIIHRDIKPENIFLVDDDGATLAKVLDFGIAKHSRWEGTGKLTNPEHLVGTPAYMSRDRILDSRPIDVHADLWSLAVVAYEALTGELPFGGATMAEICVAICKGHFEPPSHSRESLDERADAFFARAFHAVPEMRFSSARELALELLLATADPDLGPREIRDAFQGSGDFALPPRTHRQPSGERPSFAARLRARRGTGHAHGGPAGPTRLDGRGHAGPTLRMDQPTAPLSAPLAAPAPTASPAPEPRGTPAPEHATLSGKTSLSRALLPSGPWPRAAIGTVVVSLLLVVAMAVVLATRSEAPAPTPAAALPESRTPSTEAVRSPSPAADPGPTASAPASASASRDPRSSGARPAASRRETPQRGKATARPEDVLGF